MPGIRTASRTRGVLGSSTPASAGGVTWIEGRWWLVGKYDEGKSSLHDVSFEASLWDLSSFVTSEMAGWAFASPGDVPGDPASPEGSEVASTLKR